MGLCESGAVFQWIVAQTLAHCKGTIAYLDDILVFGATKEEHDTNLEAVLACLAKKDFWLQMSKCQFAVSSMSFLGHIISSDGIKPDPKNMQSIVDAPNPKTVTEVKSWIGMVSHYLDFFPDIHC